MNTDPDSTDEPEFYFITSAAHPCPDNQTPVLSRNTHRLPGGKPQLFQPFNFNHQFWAGCGGF